MDAWVEERVSGGDCTIIGIRESRRIMGDYVLTGDDVRTGRVFDDGIGIGAYHIDIHRPDGSRFDSEPTLPYDIPYRCLIARDIENLLVAGKCFSATHEAIASSRVIPICMAEGQAAGQAARPPPMVVRALATSTSRSLGRCRPLGRSCVTICNLQIRNL